MASSTEMAATARKRPSDPGKPSWLIPRRDTTTAHVAKRPPQTYQAVTARTVPEGPTQFTAKARGRKVRRGASGGPPARAALRGRRARAGAPPAPDPGAARAAGDAAGVRGDARARGLSRRVRRRPLRAAAGP